MASELRPCPHRWEPEVPIWKAERPPRITLLSDEEAPCNLVLRAYARQQCRYCSEMRILEAGGGVEWQGRNRNEGENIWHAALMGRRTKGTDDER